MNVGSGSTDPDSFTNLLSIWVLIGCILGYFIIPDFGHPSGQANAGVGGVAAVGVFFVYWRFVRKRKYHSDN